MSILDFLKKIKLPGFEEDFIEDPNEKAAADAPRISGRVISDPKDKLRRQIMAEEEESAVRCRLRNLVQLGDTSDPNFFPTPGFDEED